MMLTFAGYDWDVRDWAGEPGPNLWSPDLAWIDGEGFAHLQLAPGTDGLWYCSQLRTLEALGFGTYQFEVVGALDQLDPNLVLDFFLYDTAGIGMGVSRWGDPNFLDSLRYGVAGTDAAFPLVLYGTWTTLRFIWTPTGVSFRSYHDHVPIGEEGSLIASWDYVGAVLQDAMRLHMALYLFNGVPPANGLPTEIIVSNFVFVPETTPPPPVTVGTLKIMTNINAPIYLNGVDYGETSPVLSVEVEAGIYTVTFGSVEGYVTPAEQTVTVVAQAETDVSATYVPIESPPASKPFPWLTAAGIAAAAFLFTSGDQG